MRPKIPIRWIEEAEARRMFLLDGEAQPPASDAALRPELLPARKSALTALVARMTGRVARIARTRPSAGADEPAEGCDMGKPCVIRLADLRPVEAIAIGGREDGFNRSAPPSRAA